jgi:hypothetical protein
VGLIGYSTPTATAASKIGSGCKHAGEVLQLPTGNLVCTKVGKVLKFEKSKSIFKQTNPATTSNVDPIVIKAFNAYNHQACKGKHPNFTAKYLTSPGYSTAMLEQQKALFEQAMSCYNSYFEHPVLINIALVNEDDYEFLASQKSNGLPVFDAIQLRWAKFMMSRLSSGAGRFAGSAGWSVSTTSAWVLMIDSSLSSSPNAHGAAHEFVHILQSYSKSPFFPYYGDGSSSADYVNMPTWFWEGTGELLSYESISGDVSEFSENMHEVRNQGLESPSLNKIKTVDQVVSTFETLENPNGQEANMMCYAIGSVMSEYILANFGYEKYFQIMKNAGVFRDFSENLKMTIGLTSHDLYVSAAPFVLSQWKQNFS